MIPMLTLAVLAVPASLPSGLADHLREAAVVHADFAQVRTLKALSRPLKSSGSLVMARDRGVIWRIAKPLSLTYVMGPKGLLTVDGEGRKERRSAKDLPVVGQMGRIFQSMGTGRPWRPTSPSPVAAPPRSGRCPWRPPPRPRAS